MKLNWQEDDELVFADGLQSYEIDREDELAVFQAEKCVAVRNCKDLDHALAIAQAFDNVCERNLELGSTWHGKPINERGWRIAK
jgi:hypothetical protein